MRTLRSQLILSHVLPLLIVVPLIGVVLIYILETQVLFADLSTEMTQQAKLTADMAAEQPGIWQDTAQAQIFVTRFSAYHQSDLWLLDRQGNLLASNDPDDAGRLGQPLASPNLPTALAGENSVHTNYSLNLQAQIVEILVPVSGLDQEVERNLLPDDIHVGEPLEAELDDRTIVVWITEIKDDVVVIDANHPLAGESLVFDIQLVDILSQ